jgi:hypothetical protein
MSHPCAEVPTIRLSATGASAHNMAQTQLLGDYLLLWIGGPHEDDYSLCKLFLIAWKRGSVTLVSSESCSEEINPPLASSLPSPDIPSFVLVYYHTVILMTGDSSGTIPQGSMDPSEP